MNADPDKEDVRAEFVALRQEVLSTINGRVWGVITYIALAGGAAALYERTGSNFLFVVLVFAALPFLWHTAIRERSRMRIGSYVKTILECKSDLNWETYLDRWRSRYTVSSVDRWRHILGLTGVYLLVSLFAIIRLFTSPASLVERGLAVVGILLLAEAYRYLNHVYTESRLYDETFRQIRDSLENEVYVRKIAGVLVLIPKGEDPWRAFVHSLDRFSGDFVSFKRDQGTFERRDAIR